LYLFQAGDPFNGPFRQIGTMPFRNPLFGHFPNLQHEPVPMTKVEGDLQVRLMDFTVAAAKSGTSVNGTLIPFHRPGAGEDHEIVFKLDTYSPRGTNETWIIQPAELSDTTGNRVRSDNPLHFPVTDEYRFGPALWPNETGWRLKLTLKRSRGYNPEELVTFTNVPVPTLGPTNAVFVTNRIHGMPVALTVWQPTAQETAITVELPDKPAGKAVDFVELSADAGRKLTGYSVSRSDYWSANLVSSIPSNVKTVNITWAVQKTHTVEFLVKPPKAE
jgi:hypothetical protein